MKESVGGAMMLQIMASFMIIYILFMAGIMKYASVYRAKNAMVEFVERSQVTLDCSNYKAELSRFGFDGTFKIEPHVNDGLGKTYYTITLISKIELVPGLMGAEFPISGETKLIDSDIDIKQAEFKMTEGNVNGSAC